MSGMNLGILKGTFERRAFGFLVPIDSASRNVFLHKDEWTESEPMRNGCLIAYELAYDSQGREYAKSARFATVADTADRRITGWIRDYDEARDNGHLHDAGGTFYRFRACDICCEALWPEQPVTFVSQISPRGQRFALLIDAVAAKESAA